jgi:predicted dehydrogenase
LKWQQKAGFLSGKHKSERMKFIEGPVRWGIIGCGDVCEIKSGPALQKVDGSELVAVMRRDIEKARDFAMRHNVPNYYGDAAALINDPGVNAIYVATPPDSHERYAMQAMEAGKPVYIEKPVTIDSTSCKRLIAASKKYQIPVAVAHYRRGLALFRRVRELINAKAIGDVKFIQLQLCQSPKPAVFPDNTKNWRVVPEISGGGLLFDVAPHQLDIICWLFGAPTAMTGLSINQGEGYAAPDVSSLTAVFGGNILFQGLWSFNSPDHALADFAKIVGSSGSLTFPFFTKVAETRLRIQQASGNSSEEFHFPENIQHPMIEEVVTYFQGKTHNPCSLEEAIISLQMIEETQPKQRRG